MDHSTDHEIESAIAAELALLTPEVRSDPRQLDSLLAHDFEEVGRSGRLW
jgi:hypothetical protein